MDFIVHADDFGLSQGITDSILDCFDQGSLNSTSIVPNGHAFDYAIAEYKKRPGLRLSIHLNLAEGKPLVPPKDVCLLVNKDGYFCHSFPSLWIKYLTATPHHKQIIRRQIRLEIAAQIHHVTDALDHSYPIALDSHCHYHILPFVFDEILNLKKTINITYIRLPYERFFLCYHSWKNIKNYLSMNLIKWLLANRLTCHKKKALSHAGIRCNDSFIGVLFVAGMNKDVVETGLKQIPLKDNVVEILFHPGCASKGEEHLFQKKFICNYYAPWQKNEQDTLKDDCFPLLIQQMMTNK